MFCLNILGKCLWRENFKSVYQTNHFYLKFYGCFTNEILISHHPPSLCIRCISESACSGVCSRNELFQIVTFPISCCLQSLTFFLIELPRNSNAFHFATPYIYVCVCLSKLFICNIAI